MWTTEKPTKSGWYWWREVGSKEATIVAVSIEDQTVCSRYTDEDSSLDKMVGGEWDGPLVPRA